MDEGRLTLSEACGSYNSVQGTLEDADELVSIVRRRGLRPIKSLHTRPIRLLVGEIGIVLVDCVPELIEVPLEALGGGWTAQGQRKKGGGKMLEAP